MEEILASIRAIITDDRLRVPTQPPVAPRLVASPGLQIVYSYDSPPPSRVVADADPAREPQRVSINIFSSNPEKKSQLTKEEPGSRSESIASFFASWDITQHPIWKLIQEEHPGVKIFRLFVPETAIHENDDGSFSANGQLLIFVPAKRRNGLDDIAHLTIELDFSGNARNSIEVESVGLRGEQPILNKAE